MLRFLVECRADLTLADENQLTPLLFAARQGYSSACAPGARKTSGKRKGYRGEHVAVVVKAVLRSNFGW